MAWPAKVFAATPSSFGVLGKTYGIFCESSSGRGYEFLAFAVSGDGVRKAITLTGKQGEYQCTGFGRDWEK